MIIHIRLSGSSQIEIVDLEIDVDRSLERRIGRIDADARRVLGRARAVVEPQLGRRRRGEGNGGRGDESDDEGGTNSHRGSPEVAGRAYHRC